MHDESEQFNSIVKGNDFDGVSGTVSKEQLRDAQKKMVTALGPAIDSIITLAKHAESEQLRFKAATFIVERLMPKPGDDPSDSWKEFMEEIHASG